MKRHCRWQDVSLMASSSAGHCTLPSFVAIRPYDGSDRPGVLRLLAELPALYPNGDLWLGRRLEDALVGKARCAIAAAPWGPIGITIETPKGQHRLKLSTIFVHPNFRKLGIGTELLSSCQHRWVDQGLEQVYVTVAVRHAQVVLPLLTQYGFQSAAIELARYGVGRDEIVLHWQRGGGRGGCLVNPSLTPRHDSQQ